MSELYQKLINRAIVQYKEILPAGVGQDFSHCFTYENDILYFWFNTSDNSTHVLWERIS